MKMSLSIPFSSDPLFTPYRHTAVFECSCQSFHIRPPGIVGNGCGAVKSVRFHRDHPVDAFQGRTYPVHGAGSDTPVERELNGLTAGGNRSAGTGQAHDQDEGGEDGPLHIYRFFCVRHGGDIL